jgi:hypothetical protein
MGIKPNHAQIKNVDGKIFIEPADVLYFFLINSLNSFI